MAAELMPYLVSPFVALPKQVLDAKRTVEGLRMVAGADYSSGELSALVEASKVNRRYLIDDVDRIVAARSIAERSLAYRQAALSLGAEALTGCIAAARRRVEDVDLLVAVSSSGFLVPFLDAYLAGELGMPRGVRRVPITAAGCCGAGIGLRIAADYIRCNGGVAVIVAVELPSLCWQPTYDGREHIIASALFGDGAGACLVTDTRVGAGFEIVACQSYLIPATAHHMGVMLGDNGLSIVLSRWVPFLVRRHLKDSVDKFLSAAGLSLRDVDFYLVHPGGPKVLKAAEAALGLTKGELGISWEVLGSVGNTSAASTFFLMDRLLAVQQPQAGSTGLLVAMGPGFSFEFTLVRWIA